jgi:dTDP-4-dehydrorhamnose 3,5-epimerase
MVFTETRLTGVHLIEPELKVDDRGFFARVWCAHEVAARGLNPAVVQINTGFTRRSGGVRGLHYQLSPRREVKLVRCTRGAVFDVVVDLRPDSPTYCQWFGAELTAGNHHMLYVPEGCAHGYQTLAAGTELCYQASESYAAELARGVRFDDPAFGITWPLPVTSISATDRSWTDYQPHPPGARVTAGSVVRP